VQHTCQILAQRCPPHK